VNRKIENGFQTSTGVVHKKRIQRMKKKLIQAALIGCAMLPFSTAQARPVFDKNKDLLIAQFDNKPDTDDIHSQAAIGCMLAHPDFKGVAYYAVSGAYGDQPAKFNYIDSTSLFKLAFGEENTTWTDAHTDWLGSVTRIKDVAKQILQSGGAVWVPEAGQSNITADWVAALIDEGIPETLIKSHVILVQHSGWNEKMTAATDLAYLKEKTTYVKLEDGNHDMGSGKYRTPNFTSTDPSFLDAAKKSPNAVAQALWTEADAICDAVKNYKNPRIIVGGVDYSDAVETWWIFQDESDVMDNTTFWNKYVINTPAQRLGP
jgi:hypothetical protein